MAFIDFQLAPANGPAAPSRTRVPHPQPAPEAVLSAIERQVLVLARRDRVSSLSPAGPVGRALKALFGVERSNMLADPRLEAMRRLAVLARRGGRSVARELPRFLACGYEPCHAGAVLILARAT